MSASSGKAGNGARSGHWSRRLAPRGVSDRAGCRPVSAELSLELWSRVTARDRWLLAMLAEHRVLTTTQVAVAAFGSERVARARLQMLRNFRAVVGLRPRGGPGSRPWHWALDEAGARLLAAEDGVELKWRRDHALAVLAAGTLPHTVGVNGVGIGLVAYARGCAGARLVAWWGERRTGEAVGDRVRPDGYLHWQDGPGGLGGGGGVECFVEFDTGTESHKVLVGKAE